MNIMCITKMPSKRAIFVCLYIEPYIGSEGAVHTLAARSTCILEKEIGEMCSNLSFGTILIPSPGAVSLL